MGERMDGEECEKRTIYIVHLQLVEKEQNKRVNMCGCVQCTVYMVKMWNDWAFGWQYAIVE